jgi:hypothetical protein
MERGGERMTWPRRERLILEAVLALEEEGADRLSSESLAERVGLAEEEVIRASEH